MELNINRQSVIVNEKVFDNRCEYPIECDVILPDYCPNIAKILKCNVNTNLVKSQASGEKLTLECMSEIMMYYLCDEGKLHSYQYKMPFTKTSELKCSVENPMVDVDICTDYVNARAVSPRRFEVRGAVSLNTNVIDCKEKSIIENVEQGGIQLRKQKICVNEIMDTKACCFNIDEELELGYAKPDILSIVSSSSYAKVTDYKVISGKVVSKGELCIGILYYTNTETPCLECMTYNLPISQIIDVPSATDKSVCDVRYEVISCEIEPKQDIDGDSKEIRLSTRIRANVVCHEENSMCIVKDCYSTKYDCNCKKGEVNFYNLQSLVDDNTVYKNSIQLDDDICEIIDIWCNVCNTVTTYKDDCALMNMNIKTCMFAKNKSGCIKYIEDERDMCYKHSIPKMNKCEMESFIKCKPTCTTYSIVSNNRLEYRNELAINGCIYCICNQCVIDDITVGDEKDKEKDKDNNCSLKVYYAQQGESIWDIAKKYNTSIEVVMVENNIMEDEICEKMMLLIPII